MNAEFDPISFLSGHCDGLLPPTPKPLGGRVPDRVTRSSHVARGIGSHKPCAVDGCPNDAASYGDRCPIHDRGLR